MGELRLSHPACVIAGKTRLTSNDIDILREHVFVQGITSSHEAEVLLAINTSCTEKCVEWHHYFIESMTGFIVRRCYPQGAMDDRNADWLIGMISKGGVVHTPIELDLLFHVIDVSATVPDSLTVFALRQLQIALSDDVGAWATMRARRRPVLSGDDVHMACRVLSAIARSRDGRMTPREAEMLRTLGVSSPDAAAAA